MLEGFWDWLNHWQSVALLFLVIVLPCSLFVLLIDEQTKVKVEVVDPPILIETKPILKSLSWDYNNQNITYLPLVFSVTNEKNHSVQLLMDFFCEPELIIDYGVFSASHKNGTVIFPHESLTLSIDFETLINPKNITGTYYLTVYGEPL